MFNRWLGNEPLFNDEESIVGFSAPFTSTNAGATRSPFGHILIAVTGGRLVFIYQNGAGLVYRVSSDNGATWGAARVIDTDTAAFASAVINTTTNDIHVVYSNHGTPSTTSDEGVYYRPLFYDAVTADWVTGGEQILAGGGGLYDPAVAGRRNASISTATDGRLVVTYERSEAGVVTWAALVSQTAWSVADMDIDVDMGLVADEDTRGATQQSIASANDFLWQVSRTGSTYSLSHAVMPTPLSAADGIDVTTDSTWFGDSGEMVAVAYASELDRLGIVYILNSKPHFRLYTLGSSPTLVSDTEMATDSTQSVSIVWDGSRFWMGWITDDVVKISNNDAPTIVVQTFDNLGPDEDWSWLNTAVTLREATRIVFVWSQTNSVGANNIYVGIFPTARAVTIAEVGVGSDMMSMAPIIAETGEGTDSMTAAQSIVVYEFVNLSRAAGLYNALVFNIGIFNQNLLDTEVIGLRIPLTDAGVGVDAPSKNVREAETGSGTETMLLGLTDTDTGSGSDSMSITVSLSLTDTGAGVDDISLRLPLTDAGAGVEGASSNNGSDETGVGTDVMLVGLADSEGGTGSDVMNVQINLTDSGVGVDALDNANKGNAEVGVGTDTMSVGISLADTGSGTDTFGSLRILVTDSGTGVEAVVGSDGQPVTAGVSIPTAVFVRLLMSSGDVKLKVES